MSGFERNEYTILEQPAGHDSEDPLVTRPTMPQSPVRLVIVIALAVFLIEAFLMVLLSFLQLPSILLAVLFDAILLVVLLSPVLYFFLFRPLVLEIVERKRVEEALRESEGKLKAQYDGIPVPTYTWQRVGEDFVLVDYNDAATAITQGKVADFVGIKAGEMYRDMPEILAEFSRCFTDRAAIEREMAYRFESLGEERYFAVKYAFVPPDLILVHTEDITARKRAEETLRESRDYLDRILTGMYEGVMVVGSDYRILDVNSRFLKQYGKPREKIVGRTCHEITHWSSEPCHMPEHPCPVKSVLETGVPVRMEHTHKDREGDGMVFELHAFPLLGPAGEVESVVEISHDITERKRSQEERERLLAAEREQRELAETLREVAGTLSTSLDREQVLQLILEQLARVVSYDSASVMLVTDSTLGIGQSASLSDRMLDIVAHRGLRSESQLFTPLQVGVLPHAQKVLDQQLPVIIPDTTTVSGWQRPPGGEYIRCWLGVPLVVHDRAIGLLNLDREQLGSYTERDAEIAMAFADQAAIAIENARLYEDLRNRMGELTRTQAQLVQSAKMAAIGQLAAGVAHELNNPLTGILGFAELLLRDAAPDGPAQAELNIIVTEARRMRDIVRGLLNFSRQTAPHRQKAHINLVVQETLALVRQRLKKNGVTLRERYSPNLPLLLLDVGQMKQVMLNLVTNAMQATPHGGTLTVTSERVGDEVAVRFADTGVGIPAEHLSRIFEPFFTTKPADRGTGLGLSISLGIVQEHGGRIEVESQEGKGSTFTVWIPVESTDKKQETQGEPGKSQVGI